MANNERVISYIDGFNLYFGLKDKGWHCFYWLNVKLLCEGLLGQGQSLIETKYFTSRIRGAPDKCVRQDTFFKALRTISGLSIHRGRYGMKSYRCNSCGYAGQMPSEKMTDVRIASEMVSDAYLDKYDTALLISADRDLVPVIETIKSQFPLKHIYVVFPPMRSCADLRDVADDVWHISKRLLRDSLFPRIIVRPNKTPITCPSTWV